MELKKSTLACIAIAGLLCCLSCRRVKTGYEWVPPQAVKITGIDKCYNYSRSFGLWGTVPIDSRPGRLLVREDDVLAVVREKKGQEQKKHDYENPVFTVYRGTDGQSLSFQYDGYRLLLGGKVVGLRASADGGWDWIRSAKADEMASLRFVTLDDEVCDDCLPLLKKLASVNQAIDLAINDRQAFRAALPLFTPRRIIAPEFSSDEDTKLLENKANLEALWIGWDKPESPSFLSALPQLRQLLISDWKPPQGVLLPCDDRRLESLCLSSCDIEGLSAIEHLKGLRELHLVRCERLSDIKGAAKLPELEVLTLPDSKVTDLSVVGKLPKLKWLGLSSHLSQEQFEATTKAIPQLNTLEILQADEIKSLAVLKESRELRNLVLLPEKDFDMAPLREMKQLRVLVLAGSMLREKQEELAALEKALPECTVAAGELCLGSGWILLLVPAIALGRLLRRRAS